MKAKLWYNNLQSREEYAIPVDFSPFARWPKK